jgi:hypothetical protein
MLLSLSLDCFRDVEASRRRGVEASSRGRLNLEVDEFDRWKRDCSPQEAGARPQGGTNPLTTGKTP